MRTALLASLLLAMPPAAEAYDPQAVDSVLHGGDCAKCDLSGANLRGAQLSGRYLYDANLRGADLTDADLSYAIVDFSDLRGAKLRDADLSNATFVRANLDGADLTEAILFSTLFTGASLQGTNFAQTNVHDAIDANLSGAFGLPYTPPPLPPPPQGANPDLYVGTVFMVAFDYCPVGTHEADGTTYTIADHQILYSLYGNTYGGQAAVDFKLPDLRNQVPLAGLRACVVMVGTYPAQD